MTRYMLSVHSVPGEVREPMSAEEMQQSWQQIGILESEMKSQIASVTSQAFAMTLGVRIAGFNAQAQGTEHRFRIPQFVGEFL